MTYNKSAAGDIHGESTNAHDRSGDTIATHTDMTKIRIPTASTN